MHISIHKACKLGFEIFEIHVDGLIQHTFMSYEIAKTKFDRLVIQRNLRIVETAPKETYIEEDYKYERV